MQPLATRMGYAARFLRQHRPDLCPTIVAHFQAYRAAPHLRRLDRKWSLVTHVVAQLHRQDLYPRQGRVTQYLANSTALLEPEVKGTWRQAVRDRGWVRRTKDPADTGPLHLLPGSPRFDPLYHVIAY